VMIEEGPFSEKEGRITSINLERKKIKIVLEKLGWEITDIPLENCKKIL